MEDRIDTRLVAGLFISFLCLYIFFAGGHYGGDAVNNYLTAKSIVERGALDISEDMIGIQEIKRESVGAPGRDGRTFSPFGLGMPLLMVPLYLIGMLLANILPQFSPDYITFFITSFTNTVTSALNVLLIYAVARQLGARVSRAAALALIYGLSTMAIVYSKVGFTEPVVIMFMLAAFYMLLANRYSPSALKVFLAGSACGLMFFTRIYSIIFIPCFLVYIFIASGRRMRDSLLFLTAPALFLIAVFLLNYYMFGGITETAYGSVPKVLSHGREPVRALYYYLLSTGKGIFFYNPALILTLFYLPAFLRIKRREAVFILLALLVNGLFFANMFVRGSIFSWGPRYIFPLVPLLLLFLVEGLGTLKRRLTALIFCLAGIAVQIPALFMNFSRYIYFVKEKLGLDEYMINIIPDLSPIKGTWALFLSWISRVSGGPSRDFIYAPDMRMVEPIRASLEGYDFSDLWFLNIIRAYPGSSGLVKAALLFLGVIFIASASVFILMYKKYAREDRP